MQASSLLLKPSLPPQKQLVVNDAYIPQPFLSTNKSTLLANKDLCFKPQKNDTFSKEKQSNHPPLKKPWGLLISSSVILTTVAGISITNRQGLSQWFSTQIPISSETLRTTASKSVQNTETLKAMHAVFNQSAPDGKPWFTTVVNVLGEQTLTSSIDYQHGVTLLKDAKSLYLGDLHGSWLKALLQLAQMEAIQMPEVAAKQFISIYNEFEALINADKERLLQANQPAIQAFKWTLSNAKHNETQKKFYSPQAVDREVKAYEHRLINVLQFTDFVTKQKTHELVGQFKTALNLVDWIGGSKQLILMGDVLADRGHLDLLNLLLLEKFKPNVTVVISNHDFDALQMLRAYKLGCLTPTCFPWQMENNSHLVSANRLLLNTQYNQQEASPYGRLLSGLNSVQNPSFSEDEVISLYTAYFNRLKLAHYSAEDETLSTHCLFEEAHWQALVNHIQANNPLGSKQTRSSLTHTQQLNAFEALNKAFQGVITPELANPSSQHGTDSFKKLQELLHKTIWFPHETEHHKTFPYEKSPKFNWLKHQMLGHITYNGGFLVQRHNLLVHQLDNVALKFNQTGAESPVVITK